ncbi:MAG: hypothetical protein U0230_20730 [Polyangiales bacterium]
MRAAASLRRPYSASHPVEWFGTLIAPVGAEPPASLDGASYGLAFVLGEISSIEDRPLRSYVAALGVIDAEGNVSPVDGFEPKARVVRDWLPGIGTVLVAPGEAERFQHCFGQSVEVIEVATVEEARELALAEPRRESGPWTDENEARALLALALEERPSKTNWRSLAVRAGAFGKGGASRTARAWARLAKAITTRHVGGDTDESAFHDPCLPDLPRTLYAKVQAHHLQSLVDAADDAAVALARSEIARLQRTVPSRDLLADAMTEVRRVAIDCIREERMILGAAARCLSIEDPESAAVLAGAVVEGWFQNLEPGSASHPLALHIRCLGVSQDRPALERAIDRFVYPFRDAVPHDWTSQAFVDYELARAWVLLGEPARALEELDPYRPQGSRVDCARGLASHIHRWTARIRILQGDREAAHEERASLWSRSSEREPGVSVQQLLARLDEAIELERGTEEILGALLAHPSRGALVRAILRTAPAGTGAAWLANRYPY